MGLGTGPLQGRGRQGRNQGESEGNMKVGCGYVLGILELCNGLHAMYLSQTSGLGLFSRLIRLEIWVQV